MLGSKIN